MPNKLRLDAGPAEDLVRLNVRIARGLKADVAAAAAARGKNLNDWVRDALHLALAADRAVRRPGRGRR